MTDYYLLMPRDNLGGARLDAADPEFGRKFNRQLRYPGHIDLDRPLRFTREGETLAADWLWGIGQVPLLSPAFREVIDEYRGPADEIQWLPATLIDGDGSEKQRWIPHFPGERDILDPDWTEWGPSGLPILWYLSPTKMTGVSITTRPNHSGNLIVSNELMRALRRAKLTGYTTMRARVAGDGPPPGA